LSPNATASVSPERLSTTEPDTSSGSAPVSLRLIEAPVTSSEPTRTPSASNRTATEGPAVASRSAGMRSIFISSLELRDIGKITQRWGESKKL
jgi:hypothetical protein